MCGSDLTLIIKLKNLENIVCVCVCVYIYNNHMQKNEHTHSLKDPSMAEHEGQRESAAESLVDKITEKTHDHHSSSSSSDSDDDKLDAVKSKIFRLFGREKPVHKVLGGGKRKHTITNISL